MHNLSAPSCLRMSCPPQQQHSQHEPGALEVLQLCILARFAVAVLQRVIYWVHVTEKPKRRSHAGPARGALQRASRQLRKQSLGCRALSTCFIRPLRPCSPFASSLQAETFDRSDTASCLYDHLIMAELFCQQLTGTRRAP